MAVHFTPLFKAAPTMIGEAFIAAIFMLPSAVLAAGVGEVLMHSTQDEPLHLRVSLIPGQGEQVESSCLSLIAPDAFQQDTGIFLTQANLSVVTEGKQQYINIQSFQPAGNTYTKLRLQIKCPGVLGLIKTLTIPHPLPSGNNIRSPSNPVFSGKTIAVESASSQEEQKRLAATLEDMQQKIQLLEDELRKVKLQLAQANASSSTATADAQNSNFNLAASLKHWLVEGVLEAIEMMALAFLFLWLGLRFYNRRSPAKTHPAQPVSSTHIAAGNLTTAPMTSTPLPPTDTTPHAVMPHFISSLDGIDGSAASDDSMLEEASLYAANGRVEKAVDILKEIVGRNPSKEDAWKLLLSTYSALGKAIEFEKTARNFLKYHNASPSWSGIQVLGRTLDRDNPLYASQNSQISASPLLPSNFTHRPIGDVLIEMGALSKQEVMKYLDEFDPRQHGRFGGYLVARKAITLGQLDLALLRQQGSSNIETKPDNMPSLQEVEKLLAEFDPKQHGSVIKFLASRNIALPDQLGQYLLQQKSKSEPV